MPPTGKETTDATTATISVPFSPASMNQTAHCCTNGFHFGQASSPVADNVVQAQTATATTATMISTVSTRIRTRPRGPGSSNRTRTA